MTHVSPPTGRYSEGEFRIGHVLSQTWAVFSAHFLTFVLVTGIAYLPLIFAPQPVPGAGGGPFQNAGMSALLFVLFGIIWVLSQAVLFYAAFQAMRGRPINLAESVRIGLGRFFPIIGLLISVGFLTSLASILLVVPGIMLYLAWSVATPVCVVERLGPFRSMGRSRELTRGNRWKLFGMLLLVFLVASIIGSLLTVAVILILNMTGGLPIGTTGLMAFVFAKTTLLGRIVNLVWGAIWGAFLAILIVVTYRDLRVAKEGIDTDQIASVFE
jgi:uncharacterized membrane protein